MSRLFVVLSASFLLAACADEPATEELAEEIDQATNEISEGFESMADESRDAEDELEDSVEQAADEAADAADDAADEVEQAADELDEELSS